MRVSILTRGSGPMPPAGMGPFLSLLRSVVLPVL